MARDTYFEMYQDPQTGKWKWRFCDTNGRVVGESGEGYARKGSCENSIGIMRHCPDAPLITKEE